MLSFVIHAGYEGGDIAEKTCIALVGYVSFIFFFFFAIMDEVVCDHKSMIDQLFFSLYYISLKNNSTWMLNTQHFGYEPTGTYQDVPLYHRPRFKEVKLSLSY